MADEVSKYIKKHTLTVTMLIILSFILLAAGEYYLYRKIMYVNSMVSEGFMQIKEGLNNETKLPQVIVPTPTPTIKLVK